MKKKTLLVSALSVFLLALSACDVMVPSSSSSSSEIPASSSDVGPSSTSSLDPSSSSSNSSSSGSPVVPVSSVTLNEHNLELDVGDTFQLVPTVLPVDATDKTVHYDVDHNTIVDVNINTGLITALKPGVATVTASCNDKNDTCVVIVNEEVDTSFVITMDEAPLANHKVVGVAIKANLDQSDFDVVPVAVNGLKFTVDLGENPASKYSALNFVELKEGVTTFDPQRVEEDVYRISNTIKSTDFKTGNSSWLFDATISILSEDQPIEMSKSGDSYVANNVHVTKDNLIEGCYYYGFRTEIFDYDNLDSASTGKEYFEYEEVDTFKALKALKNGTFNFTITGSSLKVDLVEIDPEYTITFSAGEGSGSMDSVVMQAGTFVLPKSTFTAPDGKQFEGWQVGNEAELQYPDAEIDIEGNVTITAKYEDIPANQYYVVGIIGGEDKWDATDYELVENGQVEGEYLLENYISLKAGDGIKVMNSNGYVYYPDGEDNEYDIPVDGEYKVYFRPEGGHQGWYEGYFYVERNTEKSVVITGTAPTHNVYAYGWDSSDNKYVVEVDSFDPLTSKYTFDFGTNTDLITGYMFVEVRDDLHPITPSTSGNDWSTIVLRESNHITMSDTSTEWKAIVNQVTVAPLADWDNPVVYPLTYVQEKNNYVSDQITLNVGDKFFLACENYYLHYANLLESFCTPETYASFTHDGDGNLVVVTAGKYTIYALPGGFSIVSEEDLYRVKAKVNGSPIELTDIKEQSSEYKAEYRIYLADGDKISFYDRNGDELNLYYGENPAVAEFKAVGYKFYDFKVDADLKVAITDYVTTSKTVSIDEAIAEGNSVAVWAWNKDKTFNKAYPATIDGTNVTFNVGADIFNVDGFLLVEVKEGEKFDGSDWTSAVVVRKTYDYAYRTTNSCIWVKPNNIYVNDVANALSEDTVNVGYFKSETLTLYRNDVLYVKIIDGTSDHYLHYNDLDLVKTSETVQGYFSGTGTYNDFIVLQDGQYIFHANAEGVFIELVNVIHDYELYKLACGSAVDSDPNKWAWDTALVGTHVDIEEANAIGQVKYQLTVTEPLNMKVLSIKGVYYGDNYLEGNTPDESDSNIYLDAGVYNIYFKIYTNGYKIALDRTKGLAIYVNGAWNQSKIATEKVDGKYVFEVNGLKAGDVLSFSYDAYSKDTDMENNNLTDGMAIIEGGDLTVTVDPVAFKVRVSGYTPVPVVNNYALVGSMNGWVETDTTYSFVSTGENQVSLLNVQLAKDAKFKVCINGVWDGCLSYEALSDEAKSLDIGGTKVFVDDKDDNHNIILAFGRYYNFVINTQNNKISASIVKVSITQKPSAEGETTNIPVDKGIEYFLPANPYDAPSGQQFAGWLVNEQVKQPGASIGVLTDDVTIVATWEDIPVVHYYVVGKINGDSGKWSTKEYELSENPSVTGEFLLSESLMLKNGDGIKVMNADATVYYPSGSGNEYQVAKDGLYQIYFRPNGDGGEGWYNEYFYVQELPVATTLEVSYSGGDIVVNSSISNLSTLTVIVKDQFGSKMEEFLGSAGKEGVTYLVDGVAGNTVTVIKNNTVITVQYLGLSNTFNVNVIEQVIPATGLAIRNGEDEYASGTLFMGETLTLNCEFTPANTTQAELLAWKSSDEDVATVANGVVTPVKEGNVTITAFIDLDQDGVIDEEETVRDTCQVAVEYKYSITIGSKKVQLTKSNDVDQGYDEKFEYVGDELDIAKEQAIVVRIAGENKAANPKAGGVLNINNAVKPSDTLKTSLAVNDAHAYVLHKNEGNVWEVWLTGVTFIDAYKVVCKDEMLPSSGFMFVDAYDELPEGEKANYLAQYKSVFDVSANELFKPMNCVNMETFPFNCVSQEEGHVYFENPSGSNIKPLYAGQVTLYFKVANDANKTVTIYLGFVGANYKLQVGEAPQTDLAFDYNGGTVQFKKDDVALSKDQTFKIFDTDGKTALGLTPEAGAEEYISYDSGTKTYTVLKDCEVDIFAKAAGTVYFGVHSTEETIYKVLGVGDIWNYSTSTAVLEKDEESLPEGVAHQWSIQLGLDKSTKIKVNDGNSLWLGFESVDDGGAKANFVADDDDNIVVNIAGNYKLYLREKNEKLTIYIEAINTNVTFKATCDDILDGESLYVVGDFTFVDETAWKASDSYKMVYDNTEGCYKLTIQLLPKEEYNYKFVRIASSDPTTYVWENTVQKNRIFAVGVDAVVENKGAITFPARPSPDPEPGEKVTITFHADLKNKGDVTDWGGSVYIVGDFCEWSASNANAIKLVETAANSKIWEGTVEWTVNNTYKYKIRLDNDAHNWGDNDNWYPNDDQSITVSEATTININW